MNIMPDSIESAVFLSYSANIFVFSDFNAHHGKYLYHSKLETKTEKVFRPGRWLKAKKNKRKKSIVYLAHQKTMKDVINRKLNHTDEAKRRKIYKK